MRKKFGIDKTLVTYVTLNILILTHLPVMMSVLYMHTEGFHSGDYGHQMGGQLNSPSVCMSLLIFPTLLDP